jgi:hypothetical protein
VVVEWSLRKEGQQRDCGHRQDEIGCIRNNAEYHAASVEAYDSIG